METYEKIEISIEYVNDGDVITSSSVIDDDIDHDNLFIDFDALM